MAWPDDLRPSAIVERDLGTADRTEATRKIAGAAARVAGGKITIDMMTTPTTRPSGRARRDRLVTHTRYGAAL